MQKYKDYEYKTIYSLRIRTALREEGFEPVVEIDNPYKKWLKCWRYIDTPAFEEALSKIMKRGE